MSINAVSSSEIGGALHSVVSNTFAAGIVNATLNGGASASPAGGTGDATDFTALLRALASGDKTATQTALTQLKSDSSSKTASPESGSAASSAISSGAAGGASSFATSFSTSLGSGDLQGALNALTGFLVSTGQASGNVVNTTV